MTEYCCGPLRVSVDAQTDVLHEKVAETLRLYDRRWTAADRSVALTIVEANGAAPAIGRGTYLRCARMVVDAADDGLHATTISGSQARSHTHAATEHWSIEVPNAAIGTAAFNEIWSSWH